MFSQRAPRGVSLILVLIAIALLTLLVAGAVAFTGSERAAAGAETNADTLSACTQAARNLFLANLRVAQGNAANVAFDVALGLDGGDRPSLRTGHFSGSSATLLSVTRLTDNTIGGMRNTLDLSNSVGTPQVVAGFYRVAVLCEARPSGPQKEMEFVVRVGL